METITIGIYLLQILKQHQYNVDISVYFQSCRGEQFKLCRDLQVMHHSEKIGDCICTDDAANNFNADK